MSQLPVSRIWFGVRSFIVIVIFNLATFGAGLLVPITAHAESERPSGGADWPICSDVDQWYCIESGSRDFASITDSGDGENIEEGGNVSVKANFLDENSVNWAIRWSENQNNLPDEVANQTFRFTLRTGDMEPNFTYALSDEFYLSTSGNVEDGYKLSIEASPTRLNWITPDPECSPQEECDAQVEEFSHCMTFGDCGDNTTTARINNRVISGNTQNMALWDSESKAIWKGAYLSSNAQYRSTVPIYGEVPAPFWSVDIGNPHLTKDDEVATGSFTAWVPSTYFESINSTAETAVDNGFSIKRDEDKNLSTTEDVSTVLGASSLVDGGAYIRIPSISYSSPSLVFSELSDGEPGVIEPGAPAATSITPKPVGVKLDWTAPVFDGGEDLTGNQVTCNQGEETFTKTVAGNTLTATIYGLESGVEANCSVKAENSAGLSDASNELSATPNAALTNDQDLNNDYIEDSEQPNVGDITNSTTGKTVVVQLDEDCDFSEIDSAAESTANKDSAYDYSNGFINFTAACGGPGQAPHVKLFYYNVSDTNFAVRKYNPNTHAYYEIEDATKTLETINGNQVLTVSYVIEDGQKYDVDGTVNGTIVDPVGLATSVIGSPNTGL